MPSATPPRRPPAFEVPQQKFLVARPPLGAATLRCIQARGDAVCAYCRESLGLPETQAHPIAADSRAASLSASVSSADTGLPAGAAAFATRAA